MEQAVEVLTGLFEEGGPRDTRSREMLCVAELHCVGNLLEKSYISVTDVEHAQFFIKEIALKID